MSKTPKCIYCSDGIGSTRDHIPPQGFIPTGKTIKEWITVPCCEACRKSQNDEIVRNLFASVHPLDSNPILKDEILPKVLRSFDRKKQLNDILALSSVFPVKSPDGKEIGKTLGFEKESIDRELVPFLERIGRALLYEDSKREYFKANFRYEIDPELPEVLVQYIQENRIGKEIKGVFGYATLCNDNNNFVIVDFYDGLRFLLIFQNL